MSDSEDNILTPEEMREWLDQEVRDLTKALELRLQDATDFVTAYALGRLTPPQAMNRFHTYSRRWGDAINGVMTDGHMTNRDILTRIDQERGRSTERKR